MNTIAAAPTLKDEKVGNNSADKLFAIAQHGLTGELAAARKQYAAEQV